MRVSVSVAFHVLCQSMIRISRRYIKLVGGLRCICYVKHKKSDLWVNGTQWSDLKTEVFHMNCRYGNTSGFASYMLTRNRRLLE